LGSDVEKEAGRLVRLVGDQPVGLVEPFEGCRFESGLDLSRVVSAEKEFPGLKTYSNISLSAARVTTVKPVELGCCGDVRG
jgi:hypothetical protein